MLNPKPICTMEAALAVIDGKWKIRILLALQTYQTMRFAELFRTLSGVTEKMLTTQLRELSNDGLVIRTAWPGFPLKVEYELAPMGKNFKIVIDSLQSWGEQLYSKEILADRHVLRSPGIV